MLLWWFQNVRLGNAKVSLNADKCFSRELNVQLLNVFLINDNECKFKKRESLKLDSSSKIDTRRGPILVATTLQSIALVNN